MPLACVATHCPETFPTVAALTTHVVEGHLVSSSIARTLVQDAVAALPTRTDPLGLDRNGIKKHGAPPKPKETPMQPCKLCARHAPEKCKRHGGAGAPRGPKPRTGGGTSRKTPAKKPKPAESWVLLLEKLDEQIADARADLRALERLRGAVTT